MVWHLPAALCGLCQLGRRGHHTTGVAVSCREKQESKQANSLCASAAADVVVVSLSASASSKARRICRTHEMAVRSTRRRGSCQQPLTGGPHRVPPAANRGAAAARTGLLPSSEDQDAPLTLPGRLSMIDPMVSPWSLLSETQGCSREKDARAGMAGLGSLDEESKW